MNTIATLAPSQIAPRQCRQRYSVGRMIRSNSNPTITTDTAAIENPVNSWLRSESRRELLATFPAGYYQIYIPRHSALPCPKASSLFARFLEEPSGVLPGKWQMKSKRAVFFRKNQPKKRRFRVDPGT